MKRPFIIDNSNKLQNLGFFKVLQILSFDVVLGAICGGLMAVKILDVQPGIYWWIVLGIAVWLVYTVDHLADGLRLGYATKSLRKMFHYKYRKVFMIAIILTGLLTAYFAFFKLRYEIVVFGLITGCFVLLYLIVSVLTSRKKILLFQKEIFIAVLYTIGIWGGPLALSGYHLNEINVLLIISFMLTVFNNLIIFACYEKEIDKSDHQSSIVQWLGKSKTSILIYTNGVIVFIISVFAILYFELNLMQFVAFVLVFLMQSVLVIIFNQKHFFLQKNRYRFFGDLVFVLPIVMVFL